MKLLCISKELFEKLVLTAQEFFTKENTVKIIPARAQRTKSLLKAPEPSLHGIEKAGYSAYTPTPIWQTRYSEFWQWQRVSEWWSEFGQDDGQQISHEKRHILV